MGKPWRKKGKIHLVRLELSDVEIEVEDEDGDMTNEEIIDEAISQADIGNCDIDSDEILETNDMD